MMKTALVTGGTRGIGLAVSRMLAELGYTLLLAGSSPEEKVRGVISELNQQGLGCTYCQTDTGCHADRLRLMDTAAERLGRLDVLVNNAGIAPRVRADLLEVTEESMQALLNVNLSGTFFLSQLGARLMMQHPDRAQSNPRIINISSLSAYTASVNRGEYCISKAGISMVTQLFAARLAEEGIGVFEIRPGIIRTDMTAGVSDKYDGMIREGLTPIRRWGLPEDVARAVRVLCSGDLDFSTGQILNVDGGFHIRRL